MTKIEKTIMTDLDNAQSIIQQFILQYSAMMKLPLNKLSSIVEPKQDDSSLPFLQTEIDDIDENLFIIETILNQLMTDIIESKAHLK